jgi:phosphoglycerol transferase MdoB-like AlkP superfamily enzyme
MTRKQPELKYFFFTTLLILSVVLLFILSRWLFYLLNTGLFSSTTIEITKALFAGVRFDLSAILYLNAIIILLWLFPHKLRTNSKFRTTVKWSFITINSIALLANCADIVYYRFTLKRTTSDIISYIGVGGDFDKLVPQFLKDFWYIAIIWILMIIVLFKIYGIIERKFLSKIDHYDKTSYLIQSLLFIFALSLTIVGMRGGLQLRPINIITAGNYAEGNANAIVLNTPFTILQTIGKQELKPIDYFNENELNTIYSPAHDSLVNNRIPKEYCTKKNIVIIIVESLSLEHVGFFNKQIPQYKGFTPFIDGIAAKSLTFDGISNGKKSIEGIPAILSGVPTLMSTPFISSPYSGNTFSSLPSILKSKGYSTSFFHGGTNGTMGFDSYCKTAGLEKYFGKSEYNNNADDDGSWGIWDEPFLQYFAQKINSFKQPFLASVFTLTSHHPFKVPEKYIGKFPKGKLPIQETIAYTDYSLSQFFETASKMSWFSNTLFIITADHTSEANLPEYNTDYGMFRIPIIIYDPTTDLSKYSDQKTAQQIDIVPTLLAYLNIQSSGFFFGNNLLDTNSLRFAINYKQPYYQLIENNYLLKFDGDQTKSLFNLAEDKLLNSNVLLKQPIIRTLLEKRVRAFIQQYDNSLIYNKMNFDIRTSQPKN